MRSRVIALMAAAVAATAALTQPAHAAPLMDGVYRFASLADGKCLVWPKMHAPVGTVSLGECADATYTSANWHVQQRPNGTMDVSVPNSFPRGCMRLTDDHKVGISDQCDKYAEWTVFYGSAGPDSPVWADIEHTPGDRSTSWGKLVDDPGVTARLVVRPTPIEPHHWALQPAG
ncbi:MULTISPECIES: hypothetical protein [unclassified Streptomyces]|uniref:hypothetical protein n=1 Tax=unclassified Streptomyces TaxID=2593676 RepID=UPI000DC7A661|nr:MULTISPECIES: hypothetical protein [unclassified Streptomyces]AWZ05937.1 hypothetical protein DRB89_16325 [Streptomyces sp. ICC4]AWZ12970.1 hypothetical protein DRB96_12285 [Streptomyces sp. ICC1]